ncbi:site-2 protease family protein [Patescibacteria group bacterium]
MSAEIVLIVFQVAILIMSVVIHEVSHGMAALWLGDQTAKYAGRLTLNPLKHLDPWGSFIVPFFMILTFGFGFGWAKPVPYNPYNLRDQKNGPAIVGVAGPLSNIIIALIFGLAARFVPLSAVVKTSIYSGLIRFDFESLVVAISGSFASIFFLLFVMIVFVNVILAFFNLIPIPPLDGSKLLFSIVPMRTGTKIMFEQFGFFFLLIFIFMFSGLLGKFLFTMISIFFRYIVGI